MAGGGGLVLSPTQACGEGDRPTHDGLDRPCTVSDLSLQAREIVWATQRNFVFVAAEPGPSTAGVGAWAWSLHGSDAQVTGEHVERK